MIRGFILILMGVLTIGVGIAQAENQITVKSMPPVVVRTFPQTGDTAVDTAIKEISVTFSKEMITKEMWSWMMASKDSFPIISGEVKSLAD